MELSEVVARDAIKDLVARYNSYGDSGLFDRMLELFAPDAVFEVRDSVHEGRDAIRTFFTGVPAQTSTRGERPTYLRHCTATHQIDLVDDTAATGRCYFFVLTSVGLDHWGRYLDDYRVVGGVWRFARRRVLPDGFSPGSLFGSAREIEAVDGSVSR